MTKQKKEVRIGCASAFWGDTTTAFPQIVSKGNCQYIVFDFLSEVTMSLLAGAKLKNKELGHATDFVRIVAPYLKEVEEKGIKLISNAGGINLISCQQAIQKACRDQGAHLKIALVQGDDLIQRKDFLEKGGFKEVETEVPLPKNLISANAYLGASGIVKALEEGADIIITGRVVDSALTLAPLIFEFNWSFSDYDLLASGSLAGHIIECGAHATGGNFTDWEDVQGFHDMGFPIVEHSSSGDFIVTKPENTGGLVSKGSVCEQLLYEIGDPSSYFLPDVICDFRNVEVTKIGKDKVLVKGAKGNPPTPYYKVSATYFDEYRLSAAIIIGGYNSVKKAKIVSKSVLEKTRTLLKMRNWEDYTETGDIVLGTESIYGEKPIPL